MKIVRGLVKGFVRWEHWGNLKFVHVVQCSLGFYSLLGQVHKVLIRVDCRWPGSRRCFVLWVCWVRMIGFFKKPNTSLSCCLAQWVGNLESIIEWACLSSLYLGVYGLIVPWDLLLDLFKVTVPRCRKVVLHFSKSQVFDPRLLHICKKLLLTFKKS